MYKDDAFVKPLSRKHMQHMRERETPPADPAHLQPLCNLIGSPETRPTQI